MKKAKGKGDLVTYQVLNQKKSKKKKESKLKNKIIQHMPGFLKKEYCLFDLISNKRVLPENEG